MANDTESWFIGEGDAEPPLQALLRDAKNRVVRLLADDVVTFRMRPVVKGLRTDISQPATVNDIDAGDVQYDWQTGDTDTPGAYDAQFYVTRQDGSGGRSFPNDGYIRVVITAKA